MSKANNRKIFEKKKLNNNLDLMMSFQSIHTAGDRYQVTFESVIDVEIKEDYINDDILSELKPENVRRLLGKKTTFKYSKTRNFVAEDEKADILEDLKQQFLDINLGYLSSPMFPVKLIKRNYMIAQKEDMIRARRDALLKNT